MVSPISGLLRLLLWSNHNSSRAPDKFGAKPILRSSKPIYSLGPISHKPVSGSLRADIRFGDFPSTDKKCVFRYKSLGIVPKLFLMKKVVTISG